MSTFVLVHGAFHGGWCWQRVAASLRAEGHAVYTPTLTGLGERSHLLTPDTGLDTHITDVASVLCFEDLSDIVLVGHSYGGMVVTGAADRAPARVGHLVYLDAAIPVAGESLLAIAPVPMESNLASSIVVDGARVVPFGREQLGLLGLTEPADRAFAEPKITPQPWKTFAEPLTVTNPEQLATIPHTIIDCSATAKWGYMSHPDRKPGAVERVQHATRTVEIDAVHDVMITEPRKVVELLLEVLEVDVRRGASP
jgi:pimeloyl-ACP methyl ester carboxylesterase